MWVGVECIECGTQNVVSFGVDVGLGSSIALEDVHVRKVLNFDEYYANYRHLITEIAEFPIKTKVLLRKIRDFFNCSTSLAYDILERMKIDLGLYEQNGVIYEV